MATPRLCSVEGCDKRVLARGWCRAHYNRWQNHGDPIGGAISKGEAQRYFREVVMAYDGNECLTWPYDRSSAGYGRFHYNGKQRNVSRVVCEEKHGPPPTPKHQAAHSCGNGSSGCVTKRHMSWKTPLANNADKIEHGTSLKGEKNASAKLTAAQCLEIRALRGVLVQREIAVRFGVTQSLVSQIQLGKLWNDGD